MSDDAQAQDRRLCVHWQLYACVASPTGALAVPASRNGAVGDEEGGDRDDAKSGGRAHAAVRMSMARGMRPAHAWFEYLY